MEDVAGAQASGLIETSRHTLIRTVFINKPFLTGVLLLSGSAFCVAAAQGLTHALCVTEGCQIYQGYAFLGLSLHIWGAAAFAFALLLLAFRPMHYPRFISLCMWAEILLLSYQVAYLPCSECLLVGLVWGLLALLDLRKSVSVKVWSVVFLAALVLLGKNLLHPWPVYGRADAPVKLYFSPSCKACRGEIEKLLASGEAAREQVAFFPVALNNQDFERVQAFQSVINRTLNLDQAFEACWTTDVGNSNGLRNWLNLRLGMIRNRLVLARMGVQKIPLVLSGSLAPGTGEPSGECGFGKGDDCTDKIAKSLTISRLPESKIASSKQIQLREGDSPETAEITPPQTPVPAAPEENAEQHPEEKQAQAPNIQLFSQYEPETDTSPQPEDNEE